MKCDELEIKYVGYGMGFYPTEDVDEAIAELKAKLETKELECANLKENALNTDKAREKWLQFSRKQAMENRRLKRALWLARAKRAFGEAELNNQKARRYEEHKEHRIAACFDKNVNKWKIVRIKCLSKAKEYK